MAHIDFTPETLPLAVKALLEANNYTVDEHVEIHGAEFDLVATPVEPFAPKLYVEVTVEHVGNEKYGKDLTKLQMVPAIGGFGRGLIVSSKGFSAPVRERSRVAVSGISETMRSLVSF